MTDDSSPQGIDRRTVLRTAAGAGAVGLLPTTAGAAGSDRPAAVDPALDLDAAGPHEVLVVFDSNAAAGAIRRYAPAGRYHVYRVLPIAYARLTADAVREVASLDSVRYVEKNRELVYYNDTARELTNVGRVQADLGYTGTEAHTVVMDSGVDGSHPDHQQNLRANYRPADPLSGDAESLWVDAGDANTDDNGHGTHVSGTVAGTGAESDGQYRGMAPEADLTVYSLGVGLTIQNPVGAFDHMIARKLNPRVEFEPQVVSNSYGIDAAGGFRKDGALEVASYRAFEAGILPLFSAGNCGQGGATCSTSGSDSLNRYAKAPHVLGVAATTRDGTKAGFSSIGDPTDNFDRETALANYEAYRGQQSLETAAIRSLSRDAGVGGPGGARVVVGGTVAGNGALLNFPTSPFGFDPDPRVEGGDFDGYRIDATMTWNPTSSGPNDVNLFLEQRTEGGWKEIGRADNAIFPVPSSSNELRLTRRGSGTHTPQGGATSDPAPNSYSISPDGEYRFVAQGEQGVADVEITATVQAYRAPSTAPSPPYGVYRIGVGAVGDPVRSTMNPGHSLQALGAQFPDQEVYYASISGTSMSCPVTAGVATLVNDAHFQRHGSYPDPVEVLKLVEATAREEFRADRTDYTPTTMGAGFVDALAAVERVESRPADDLADWDEIDLAGAN